MMTGISLFAGAGIGETYLEECGIHIVTANELVSKRAQLYREIYPNTNMICGDITNDNVFDAVINSVQNGVDFIIASPPCQGMSVAGKNRYQETMVADKRNYLITYVIEAIKRTNPKYILIENVPALLKIKLTYSKSSKKVIEILQDEFGENYTIDSMVVDSADYGVPQKRKRAIIKLYKRGLTWEWPQKTKNKVTVRDAIGYLPSIEAGETSDIKWHFARRHDPRQIVWLKHTSTGTSAFNNEVYYPQKVDGTRNKGYESSYRRIKWDEPAPTITIRNDCVSSQRNVHPGRLLADGTYSDARVLTPLEIILLNSLPANWKIPNDTPEILIRQCIGESIPPLMIKKIVEEIENGN